MSNEKELIKLINQLMPKTEAQHNKLFESDSEIVDFGERRLLFSIDEFSEEDMLREADPYSLGWNVTVGSISDILASGGTPVYYLHSMTVGSDWDEEYIREFSTGVSEALKKAGTCFIGGDFGRSKEWRYTATVVGSIEGEPVLRKGASEGDAVYITGKIGLGNVEAFLKLYEDNRLLRSFSGRLKTLFNLRLKEAELIRKYCSSSIDTSDGVFKSISTISEMSGTGYELCNLPYTRLGLAAARMFSMPKTLLFLGECGEYELLFTVPEKKEKEFLQEADKQQLEFYWIGTITKPSIKVLREGRRETDLGKLDISARSFDDMKDYIKELLGFLNDR